jgi:ATP/maltotriose-dependent transcriptional regulator MalT
MLGRWDEALGMIEEPTEEQTRSGGVLLSLLQSVVEIHLARGDVQRAHEVFSLFDHLEGSSDQQDRASRLAARASLRLADGRLTDAIADAETAIDAASTLGYGQQGAKHALTVALEAALALGDEAKARALIAIVEEAPPGRRAPYLEAQAQRFRARLDGDLAGFEAAERIFREHELPFWLAVTRLEHAEALAADGRADEAEPLLAEARETFDSLAATPWLERAERARAAGSTAVPL